METFKRKNDLGVEIEYTVIGKYKEDCIYLIYTDFVSENNIVGFRLYVDVYDFNDNYIRSLDSNEAKVITDKFNNEIIAFKGV